MPTSCKAPFPYFGGKSLIAPAVWHRFGTVQNYVEPFAGSAAVLLARPDTVRVATINDLDCFLCNFWRALAADPDAVAAHARWPTIENDLHARNAWLTANRDTIRARIEGDPDYYDARVAGWWAWGQSTCIGNSWCTGTGPWAVQDAQLHRNPGHGGPGITRALPRLGGFATGTGSATFQADQPWHHLANRLRQVRVACGDFRRVLSDAITVKLGTTAVFLDPPYAPKGRSRTYTFEDGTVHERARAWAIAHGNDSRLRIALCGYEGDHDMPADWTCLAWKTNGGYGNQGQGRGQTNATRERIWFSPHCLDENRN